MNENSSPRDGTPISLIAVHTNEGPNDAALPDLAAENLIRWMGDNGVSYHRVCDDDSCPQMVADDRVSWSLRRGNSRSLNLCFIGSASWTRPEWLAHPRMLELGAEQAARWAEVHDIPLVKLSPAQVGADRRGFIGHIDWTLGKNDGSHTDPGDGFPWDVFMDLVRKYANMKEDDLSWDDVIHNYAGKGNDEPARYTLGFLEKRIMDRVDPQLAGLRADVAAIKAEVTDQLTSKIDGRVKASEDQFIEWIDATTVRIERAVAALSAKVDALSPPDSSS